MRSVVRLFLELLYCDPVHPTFKRNLRYCEVDPNPFFVYRKINQRSDFLFKNSNFRGLLISQNVTKRLSHHTEKLHFLAIKSPNVASQLKNIFFHGMCDVCLHTTIHFFENAPYDHGDQVCARRISVMLRNSFKSLIEPRISHALLWQLPGGVTDLLFELISLAQRVMPSAGAGLANPSTQNIRTFNWILNVIWSSTMNFRTLLFFYCSSHFHHVLTLLLSVWSETRGRALMPLCSCQNYLLPGAGGLIAKYCLTIFITSSTYRVHTDIRQT